MKRGPDEMLKTPYTFLSKVSSTHEANTQLANSTVRSQMSSDNIKRIKV